MDIVSYLTKEWNTITSAPVVFITGMIIVGGLVYVFTKQIYGEVASALRERLAAAKEDNDRLKAESTKLNSELDNVRKEIDQINNSLVDIPDSIAELKKELDSRPKIHVGPTPPENMPIGALWIDTSDTEQGK